MKIFLFRNKVTNISTKLCTDYPWVKMNVGIKVQPSFANRQEVFVSDSVDVTSDHAFCLMSYNVLADCHTHPSTYPYRNPDQLHINSRHKGLMEELRYSNCDVICLQEVGPGYYKDTLEPEMKKLGYEGIFVKRTFDKNDEGCATFYKTCKFVLQDNMTYLLGDIAAKILSERSEKDNLPRYTNRCDVALVCLLKHVHSDRTIIICNTHLVWESALIWDVRLIQALGCIKALKEYQKSHPGSKAMILCGDFNTEPTEAAYDLVVRGEIGEDTKEKMRKEYDIKMEDIEILLKTLQDEHLVFRSAYKDVMGTEPRITNLDGEFCVCLDYIFYKTEGQCLQVTSVVDFLSEEEMRRNLPPSEVFPSDHLPLIAKFLIKK
ncbi:uncharacterized protein LOC111103002 isoform X1 [Crassostrea virginica]